MKILLVCNASLDSKKFLEQNKLLFETAKLCQIELIIKKNNEISYNFSKNGVIVEKLDCDAVLFYDKDVFLAKALEKNGYKVFNSSDAIEKCDNKALSYEILAQNNLPIPKTVVLPLLFFYKQEYIKPFVENLENQLSYPMVAKKWFGSEGKQVFLVENRQMLLQLLDSEKVQLVFQEYCSECFGKDIRINIVNGEIVASMQRFSDSDFRANLSNGGSATLYIPTTEEAKLALKTAEVFGCDFCGVDILQTNNGPVVCEINSNAHLENIYKVTTINVAKHILEFVINKTKNRDEN